MPKQGKTGSELFPCIGMRLKYTCIGMRLHLRRQRQVACSRNINRAERGAADRVSPRRKSRCLSKSGSKSNSESMQSRVCIKVNLL